MNAGFFEIENGVLVKYTGEEKQITVPAGVTVIGEIAFYENRFAERVLLPDGVTRICRSAFKRCKALKEVCIPDSVRYIEHEAFAECEALFSVSIPEGVEYVEGSVFHDCSALSEIRLPNGIKGIWNSAFSMCISLKSIRLPEGVTEIGNYAFSGCTSLRHVEFPEGLRRIGSHAFSICMSLERAVIPRSVKEINGWAFSGCGSKFVLDMDFRLMKQLDGGYENAKWSAVRGFLARRGEGLTSPEENAWWRTYVARRTVKAFENMADEPDFYRYVTENKIINPKRVTALLDITQNTECRAILLAYANRPARKSGSEGDFITLPSDFEL